MLSKFYKFSKFSTISNFSYFSLLSLFDLFYIVNSIKHKLLILIEYVYYEILWIESDTTMIFGYAISIFINNL